MKKILCLIAFVCAFTVSASEFRTIFRADCKNVNSLKNFSVYNHKDHASNFSLTVFEGVPAVKLQVTESARHWYNRIQFRLLSNTAIEACAEYRIKFRCRADKSVAFRVFCQEGVSPWEAITEHKPGTFTATPEWQEFEYTFTATKDTESAVWLPNFECGLLEKGNALYLTDIKVEALDAEKATLITKPDPQGMEVYCQKGFAVQRKNSVENGSPVGGVTLSSVGTVANPSQVQFRHPITVTTVKGAKYRLSFYHKADKKAVVLVSAQQGVSPWAMLSPQSNLKITSTPEWDYFEMNFTAAANYSKLTFLPNIGLGFLGKGNTFYIREVKFERVD